MNRVSVDNFTLATFLPLVNTVFRVRLAESIMVELKLTRATPPRHAPSDASDHKSFSLIFLGPADRPLEQQIHLFEHDQIGQFELFVVPVGRNSKGLEYQSVFNRLEPEE